MNVDELQSEDQVKEQKSLSFLDDTLLIVATHDHYYIALGDMCQALGLKTRGQQQRIQRSPALLAGFRHLDVETAGGRQSLSCLNIKQIELWLATIRAKQASNLLAEKIDCYRRDLPAFVQETFGLTVVQEYSVRTMVIETLPTDTDQHQQEMLAILANLPSEMPPTGHVSTTNSQVDRSLREASFATEDHWVISEDTRIFSSTTQLQIYLGTPQAPLDLIEAQTKIAQLGASTILTSRIMMSLWNLRRDNAQLSINGSAAIRLDEILAWRGLQQHQRPLYPGSDIQRSDGYRPEHKQQVLTDLELLSSCCVRGNCEVNIKGRRETLYINGPYLRYSIVAAKKVWKAQDVLGFFVSPGDWISSYKAHTYDFLAEIDYKIFQLNPQNDQMALRIALYLVEQWRQQAAQRNYGEPYIMQELLAASMIEVDHDHFERFASRVESAFLMLKQRGIVGAVPSCLTPVSKKGRWKKEWLASQWIILPPSDLMKRYQLLEGSIKQLNS